MKSFRHELHGWDSYGDTLRVEYEQCEDEGKDIARYKPLFDAVIAMDNGELKEKFADALFELQCGLPQRADYPYAEPSDLAGIRALRGTAPKLGAVPGEETLRDKVLGAWNGRIAGCLLGKPVEGARTPELHAMLRETGNWPLHRYILLTDVTEEVQAKYKYHFGRYCMADNILHAPVDDDTNYMVLDQQLVKKYGRDFTPENVRETWLRLQPMTAYCTAERVAYHNFIAGLYPPGSAEYKNSYREWIGAQIRGDYFGYINPGDPETAAEMAWRDASISHVKNGIYGEMFASAMIAAAAVCDDVETVIQSGLAQVPATSRLYKQLNDLIADFHAGVTREDCFKKIHEMYNEFTEHGWCHTISNALIVTAALLYGGRDYEKSICMAVQTGFDTDCNGATVGSVLGMMLGSAALPEKWIGPLNGKLDTSIALSGFTTVDIAECAELTLAHMKKD